jgi:hypothetical protein
MITIVSSTISSSSGQVSSFQVPINNQNVTGVTNVVTVAIDGNVSVSSVTDSQGTNYTLRKVQNDSGSNIRTEIWSTEAGAAPGGVFGSFNMVTINFSAATKVVASVSEWSGVVSIGTVSSSEDGGMSSSILNVSDYLDASGNVLVAGFSWAGSATASQNIGVLRASDVTTSGRKDHTSQVSGALAYNTSGVQGSLIVGISLSVSSFWSACVLELNS